MKIKLLLATVGFLSLKSAYAIEIKDCEDLNFSHVVKAQKNKELIELKGEKYTVLREEPVLEYQGWNDFLKHSWKTFASGNPCYKELENQLGRAPSLFKPEYAPYLPNLESTNFFVYQTIGSTDGKYLTCRFTSNNNPHWAPEGWPSDKQSRFADGTYWHQDNDYPKRGPEYSINFLLEKISP